MNNHLFDYDINAGAENIVLCGVDEAGRGPLCGPVCCAAVVLDYNNINRENDILLSLNDSKKISKKKRDILYDEIVKNAVAYNIVMIDNFIIDEINILNATMLGMKQAVEGLSVKPDFCLIDGNRCPDIQVECTAVVKGDASSAAIAAASILAKVSRDRFMQKLDAQYPEYYLSKHNGYGTALHYEMIKKHGIKDFYRKSFLKKILNHDS